MGEGAGIVVLEDLDHAIKTRCKDIRLKLQELDLRLMPIILHNLLRKAKVLFGQCVFVSMMVA